MSKKLTLSEAIREGSKLRPQATDGGSVLVNNSCALMAAAEAVGLLKNNHRLLPYVELECMFPILEEQVHCPPNKWNQLEMRLEHAIWVMNDELKWTREKIADWIDGLGLELEVNLTTVEEINHTMPNDSADQTTRPERKAE